MYQTSSTCEVCGKKRNSGNHSRCSRIKQARHSHPKELELQRKIREARKKDQMYLVYDGRGRGNPGIKSRLDKLDG